MNCFGPLTILAGKDGSSPFSSYDHCKKLEILQDLDIYYIRQLVESVQSNTLKEKLEIEIKMREGVLKLLNVCKHIEQSMEASKNLIMSNERMIIYMDEMQRLKTELRMEKNCSFGQVCISNIRIPLIWKEADHFKNKEWQEKYAVFCLLKTSSQVFATKILGPIDGSFTDITFEDVIVFDSVDNSFVLTLELYMYLYRGKTFSVGNIKAAFHKPVNWKIGKRLADVSRDGTNHENIGIKFTMIAAKTFTVKDVNTNIKSHDLVLYNQENSLPLFGYVCLRLACKPDSMDSVKLEGTLQISKKEQIKKKYSKPETFYVKLQSFVLKAWDTAVNSELVDNQPFLTVSILDIAVYPNKNPKVFTISHGETKYKLIFLSAEERTHWYDCLQSCTADSRKWYQGLSSPMEFLPSQKPMSPVVWDSDFGSSSSMDGAVSQNKILTRPNTSSSLSKFNFSRSSLRFRSLRKSTH